MTEDRGQGTVVGTQSAGARVLILGHKCYRCGHEWRPNNLETPPRVCPKCKNPYWDRPRKDSVKHGNNKKKSTKLQ